MSVCKACLGSIVMKVCLAPKEGEMIALIYNVREPHYFAASIFFLTFLLVFIFSPYDVLFPDGRM